MQKYDHLDDAVLHMQIAAHKRQIARGNKPELAIDYNEPQIAELEKELKERRISR